MDNDVDLNKIFLAAIAEGSEDQVSSLIASHGFCHTADGGYSLLLEAINCLQFPVAKILITSCVQVNSKEQQQRSRDTPLHLALGFCQLYIAELLLDSGADINALDSSGVTSIENAIKLEHLEFLELLYDRDFDLNARGPDGLRPLHIAAKEGKEDAVIILLSYGADIDASSSDNKTALYIAAEEGQRNVVERLLQFQPDVNNEVNKRALYAAVFSKNRTFFGFMDKIRRSKNNCIFDALLEYGFIYELEPGCDPQFFHGLVEHGFFEIVEDLLLYGADVNMDNSGQTPLLMAMKHNQTDVADLLVFYGADVNAQDGDKRTPIFYAVEFGNAKLFNILTTHGATISDFPCVVHAAIYARSLEIVEQLLKLGNVDVNNCIHEGTTPLLASLEHRCENITSMLLDKGADVNDMGTNGNLSTPLHYACMNGDLKNCETMLKNGAEVNYKNYRGFSPLYFAETAKMVKTLVQFGADVHSRNMFGKTPLHSASYAVIAKALLECGADVNARDRKGRTPLYYASQQTLEILLTFGANIDFVDRKGKTPLHVAWKALDGFSIKNLLDYGADINICNKKNRTPFDCALSKIHRAYDNKVTSNIMELFWHFAFHIVRIQTIEKFVSARNLRCMLKILNATKISVENFTKTRRPICEEEIGKLQAKKISNLNISYYELLTKNTNSLAILLRHDKIMQAFKPDDVKADEFPNYGDLLKCQFWKAVERKKCVELGCKMFENLCRKLPRLSACCVEAIFQYLSSEDLQMVVEACKAPSQCQTEGKLMTSSDSFYDKDSSSD